MPSSTKTHRRFVSWRDAVRFTNHPSEQPDLSALGSKKSSIEDKRNAIRGLVQSAVEFNCQHRASLLTGNLDDVYNPRFHTLRGWFNHWDHTADAPHYRQDRINQIIQYENMIDELKSAGKVKVYKGNPRAQWQVLDESFAVENRMAAQAAVKDYRAAALGLPNQSGTTMSQKRRSTLVVEEETDAENYRQLPYQSQYI